MILTNDSQHSVSSTFSVEQQQQEPKNQCSPLHLNRPRSVVSFDEDSNEYFSSDARAAEDCHETWFTDEDYSQFRSHTRRIIVEAVSDNEMLPFCKVLYNLYDSSRQVDFVLSNAADALTLDQEDDIQCLYDDEKYLNLIGLELRVATAIRKDALQRRKAVQDAVYDIQSECDRGLWSEQDAQEELRESCLHYTQTMNLFAQLLAKAQSSTR